MNEKLNQIMDKIMDAISPEMKSVLNKAIELADRNLPNVRELPSDELLKKAAVASLEFTREVMSNPNHPVLPNLPCLIAVCDAGEETAEDKHGHNFEMLSIDPALLMAFASPETMSQVFAKNGGHDKKLIDTACHQLMERIWATGRCPFDQIPLAFLNISRGVGYMIPKSELETLDRDKLKEFAKHGASEDDEEIGGSKKTNFYLVELHSMAGCAKGIWPLDENGLPTTIEGEELGWMKAEDEEAGRAILERTISGHSLH